LDSYLQDVLGHIFDLVRLSLKSNMVIGISTMASASKVIKSFTLPFLPSGWLLVEASLMLGMVSVKLWLFQTMSLTPSGNAMTLNPMRY